ncbi:MAG: hypothetical protein JO264_15870 [Acidisphaera sp.]|nr:hypothetical protein [Acidisphaera sp.]
MSKIRVACFWTCSLLLATLLAAAARSPARRVPPRPVSRLFTVWELLVDAAAAGRTVTYAQVAERIGGAPSGVGQQLRPVESYCRRNNLPLLTALVVRKGSGRPGRHIRSIGDPRQLQRRVWSQDWSAVPNPFA